MAPADIVSLAESILGVAGWVAFSPIGAVAESQQEQEDAQEGSGRDHLGAAWVAVRGAEAVQGLLRGLRWASAHDGHAVRTQDSTRLEAEAAALTQARLAQVSGTKPGGRKPLHALRIQKRSQTQ